MLKRIGPVTFPILFGMLVGCARLLGTNELSFDGVGGCAEGVDCATSGNGSVGDAEERACQSHRECPASSAAISIVC